MSTKTFVKALNAERVAYDHISALAAFIVSSLPYLSEGKEIYVGAHAHPQGVIHNTVVFQGDVFDLIHDWAVSKDELEIRVVDLGMYIALK